MITYVLAAPLPALNLGGVFKAAGTQAAKLGTALKPQSTVAKVSTGVALGAVGTAGLALSINALDK